MRQVLKEDRTDLRVPRRNVTVRQQVVDILRAAILQSHFKPGDRLTERELCARTGASRSSVREALRHLESEGLVSNVANRGPVVASVTMDEARQIYQAREVLESLAGRLFAARVTDEQIKALNEARTRLEHAFATANRNQISADTVQLYDIILTGSGNEVAAGYVRSLRARVLFLESVSMSHPDRAHSNLGEMQAIVAAIVRRDANAAAEACADHVRQAARAALKILGSREGF